MHPFSRAPGWVAVGVAKCKQMKEWILILLCWERLSQLGALEQDFPCFSEKATQPVE